MKLSINGQEYEFENGKNALDIAGEISKDLKKEALVARLDGKVISLVTPINEDGGVLEIDRSRSPCPRIRSSASSAARRPVVRAVR